MDSARWQLRGRLLVLYRWDDNGGGASTETTANITWTGGGSAMTATTYEKYTDGDGNRYTLRRTENARQGTLSGSLGDMTFGDDADDQSWGYFGSFKTASTSVSP